MAPASRERVVLMISFGQGCSGRIEPALQNLSFTVSRPTRPRSLNGAGPLLIARSDYANLSRFRIGARGPAAETEAGNFGRTCHTHRHHDLSDTPTNINLRSPELIPSRHEAFSRLRAIKGTQKRQPNLPTVGVSGKYKVDTQLGGRANPSWIVAEKNLGIVWWNELHSGGKIIGRKPQVVNAYQPQCFATVTERVMCVAKDANSLSAERARYFISIHAEIVVTEHGEDAESRAEPA